MSRRDAGRQFVACSHNAHQRRAMRAPDRGGGGFARSRNNLLKDTLRALESIGPAQSRDPRPQINGPRW